MKTTSINQDITVLIPSIGRKSVFDAINSVDIDCNILALVSGDISEDIKSELNRLDQLGSIKLYNVPARISAGYAKDLLIGKVATKYFFILDDDDQLTPGFLTYAYNALESSHFSWFMTGFANDGSTDYSSKVVVNVEDLHKYYFEYDKYSPEYIKDHLYPNSECLLNTAHYKKWSHTFEAEYGDDIIPMMLMVMNTPGMFCSSGVIWNHGISVSRSYVDQSNQNIIYTEIIKRIISTERLRQDLWIRCLYNIRSRIAHINKF